MINPLNEKEEHYQLTLPCAPNDFGSFIAGLLGKPKTLKGVVSGHFDIGPKEISNFYYLIQQKVESQNHGNLINLSISVFYNNGLSVTHHNPNDFEKFHPTSKSIPTQVILAFTYLIKFNGKDLPEKQEIEIIISSDRDDTRQDRVHWSHSGLCKYTISHTDTSWATDISNIIKSHAESIIEKPGAAKEYLITGFGEILSAGTYLLFIGVLVYWAIFTGDKLPTLTELDSKIIYIINSCVTLIALYLISKGVIYLIEINLNLYGHSYICLTEKDFKHKEAAENKMSRKWLYYIGGWTVNIACGLISSIVFRYL